MKAAKDLKSKIVKGHVKSTQFSQSWSLVGAYCSPGGHLSMKTGNPACASCIVHCATRKLLEPSVPAAQLDSYGPAPHCSPAPRPPSPTCQPSCLLLCTSGEWNAGDGGWWFKPSLCEKNCREQWHQSCSYYDTFFSAAWCIAFQCFSNVFDLMVSSLLLTPSPPQPGADLLRRAWDFPPQFSSVSQMPLIVFYTFSSTACSRFAEKSVGLWSRPVEVSSSTAVVDTRRE